MTETPKPPRKPKKSWGAQKRMIDKAKEKKALAALERARLKGVRV